MHCAVLSCSVKSDSATPWTAVHQAPLTMGILQGRILQGVAMPSSRVLSQARDQTQVSCIAGGFFTIWAIMEAKKYWNVEPAPFLGDLPNPGIEPGSPALLADSLPAEQPGKSILGNYKKPTGTFNILSENLLSQNRKVIRKMFYLRSYQGHYCYTMLLFSC